MKSRSPRSGRKRKKAAGQRPAPKPRGASKSKRKVAGSAAKSQPKRGGARTAKNKPTGKASSKRKRRPGTPARKRATGRKAKGRSRSQAKPNVRRATKGAAAATPKRQWSWWRWLRASGWLALALVSLLFLGLLAGAWFVRQQTQPTNAVMVAWPADLSAAEGAELLHELGLTEHPLLMAAYMRVVGTMDCAKPGPHLLEGGTAAQLHARLCRTKRRQVETVTVVEGFNRFRLAERLEKRKICSRASFLHASADTALLHALGLQIAPQPQAATAEGFLFPATYKLYRNADPREVVRLMVREALRRYQDVLAKHPAAAAELRILGWGRREVITLASMVEKEAAVAQERPIIASVFLNRLRSGTMPYLQSDPTAMYGCQVMPDRIDACRGYRGKASGAINRAPTNIYSTYVSKGLPPGPIASPGASSMEAVLQPAKTDFLFFVARGQGRHTFSKSYREHRKAVEQLRKMRR